MDDELELWSGEYTKEGARDGQWLRFDNEGHLIALKTYDHGRSTTPSASWYPDGSLKVYWTGFKDGLVSGRVLTWHPNGQLAADLMYEANQLHGYCKWWNADGTVDLSRTGRYDHNVRIGE